MKVLFTTGISDSWTYIPEMIREFEQRGTRVDMFDTNNLLSSTFAPHGPFRLPAIQYVARAVHLRRSLSELPTDYDAVNIHFCEPIFRHLVSVLKRRAKKLITTIWGSDFLRAGPLQLRNLGHVLGSSDVVTANNPDVIKRLVARFPAIAAKVQEMRFGLTNLDVIAELQHQEGQRVARCKLGLPHDKVIVACGYNTQQAQQHLMMAEAFSVLSANARSRLFALILMTYPHNPAYCAEVRRSFEAAGVPFRLFETKLNREDVCRARIAADHLINIQTTDSLSASLQEHLFAGSAAIVGDWLPYRVLEELGISFERIGNVAQLSAALEKAAARGRVWDSNPPYADRLYEFASWRSNAPKWLTLLGGESASANLRPS